MFLFGYLLLRLCFRLGKVATIEIVVMERNGSIAKCHHQVKGSCHNEFEITLLIHTVVMAADEDVGFNFREVGELHFIEIV